MSTHFANKRTRRVQLLINARHFKALGGRKIFRLSFRKDIEAADLYGLLQGNEKTSMLITASWSNANPAMPAARYRDNHGKNIVTVFRGEVSLPKVSTTDKRKVASFNAGEAPTIRLQKPLDLVHGKTLCLEFETFAGKGQGHEWEWPVDAECWPERGLSRAFGRACWAAEKRPVTTVMASSLRPGMHVKTMSRAPGETLAAFLMFGMSRNLAWGSLPLPMTIAAPNCQLLVSPDVMLPTLFFQALRSSDEAYTSQAVATPQLRSLYGATLNFQYLFLYRSGTQLRIATSNAVAATFTKKAPALGMSVVASIDPNAKLGRVFLDFGPVMRFETR